MDLVAARLVVGDGVGLVDDVVAPWRVPVVVVVGPSLAWLDTEWPTPLGALRCGRSGVGSLSSGVVGGVRRVSVGSRRV